MSSKLDPKKKQEIDSFLLEGEQVIKIYQLFEDYCVISDKRLLYVDKQWTSSKKAIYTIPLSKITGISLSKGGWLSFTKEVEIIVASKGIELKFIDGQEAHDFYLTVSKCIL